MNHPDPVTQTRTIRGPRTLLEMCLDLRMAHNGSADPISEEETAAALAYLRHRLDEWERPALASGARFDAAVNELVRATIAEVAPVISRVEVESETCPRCHLVTCSPACIEAEERELDASTTPRPWKHG